MQLDNLLRAQKDKQLAVFCGAGISMLPPSCLPSWKGFNETILNEARIQTLQAVDKLDEKTRREIENISLNDLSVQSFSDELVDSFAGTSWFPVLEVLDSDRPNANHYALAELAAKGMLRVIVTTNFDTLIERAFRERGVRLKVFVKPEEYPEALPLDYCVLYKIHGTTKDATSLIDTASQKLSGLSIVVRNTLSFLFSTFHFMFLGFSGADFAFSEDYLGIMNAVQNGPGLTWLLAPGRKPDEAAARMVQRAGSKASFVEEKLPDFFSSLGIKVDRTESSYDLLQQEADEKARQSIRTWLALPHIGPLACAIYIERLLFRKGRYEAAQQLQDGLAQHPDIIGPDVPFISALVIFHLALQAIHRGQFQEGLRWLYKALQIHSAFQKIVEENKIPESAASIIEKQKNMSAIWVNIAVCHRSLGNIREAVRALQLALPLAHASSDDLRIGQIQFNFSAIDYEKGEDPDKVLARLDTARNYMKRAGSTQGLIDVELSSMRQLLDIGEYDRAQLVLDRAKQYQKLLGPDIKKYHATELECEMMLCRGNVHSALSLMKDLLNEQIIRDDVVLLKSFQANFCKLFGFYRPAKDMVLQVVDQLIASTTSSELSSLSDYRTSLVDNSLPEIPHFLWDEPKSKESQVRWYIRWKEFQGEKDRLPESFKVLFELCYERRSSRLIECAWAYLEAAKRVPDQEAYLYAQRCMGVAYDIAGNLDEAVHIYESMLSNSLPPNYQAMILQHLALVKSKQGNAQEADSLFEESLKLYAQIGDISEFVRCQMTFAVHLLKTKRVVRAQQIAEQALEKSVHVSDPRARPTLEFLVTLIKNGDSLTPWSSETVYFPLTIRSEPSIFTEKELDILRKHATSPEEYGQLSLIEWEIGDRVAAWVWSQKALNSYSASGNLVGVSRCLNNQALFHAQSGNDNKACELAQQALQIRESEGDLPGQILTLSNLVAYARKADRMELAEASAHRCLQLATESGQVSEPAGKAAILLVEMYMTQNRPIELLNHIQQYWHLIQVVSDPVLAPFKNGLHEIFDTTRKTARPTISLTTSSVFDEWFEEAARWASIGDVTKMNQILAVPPEGLKLTLEERARVEGTRGNGFQNAAQDKLAVRALKRAARLFKRAGNLTLANAANINASTSLRRLRQWDNALKLLKETLAATDNDSDHCNIFLGFASVYMERYAVEEMEAKRTGKASPPSDDLDTALKYLENAEAVTGISDHLKGILLVKKGNLSSLKGDHTQAIRLFREALVFLRRVNSPQVDAIENALANFEVDDD